ncbi:MAG: recombinase family protein [Oscillospiraceae bacterium]|nr:recombinase family protein [Oscillospiraceae bacterium]
MGKRKLPFGYVMEKGDVKAEARESNCVYWIYMTYHMGASLKEIASELNVRANISYDKDKPWNKNMIDRILQDQRYSGDALYPEIVPETLYDAVQRRRAERRGVSKQTEAQKMIRILGGGKAADTVEANILAAMNHLILHPDAIRQLEPEPADHTRHFRLSRELEAVMNQQPIDEDRAAQLIQDQAEAAYDLIDDTEYETERLRRIFRIADPMEELSADLLRKTVAGISVEIKTVKMTLKNNQTIEVSD